MNGNDEIQAHSPGEPTDESRPDVTQEEREQARLYLAVADSAPVGIYIVQESKFVFGNQVFQKIVGLSGADLQGKVSISMIYPEDRERVRREAIQMLKGQRSQPYEFRSIIGNGEIRWAIETVKSIMFLGRRAVLGIFMDITERKQVEEALEESRAFSTILMENAPSQLIVFNPDTSIRYVNPAFIEANGWSLNELVGTKAPYPWWTKEQHEASFIESFQSTLESGSGEGESLVQKRNGESYWLHLKWATVRKNEKTAYILVNSVDITERKRLEENLLKAKEAAEAATRAKSDFLANMSHEIRTPMNGVIGMAGLLADTPLNPEQRDYVQSIESSADALLTIINDILDFSKIEAEKIELEKMDFDIRSAIENMNDILAIRAREKGLEYIWILESDVPVQLTGDPGRLRQILINLIGNAIKFTKKGHVEVRVRLESETDTEAVVRFEISDTGIGISKEKLGNLFRPFTQADASTTRKYGGTGLGLSIAKRLSELMGGQIGAESEEEKGSLFWFTAKFGKQQAGQKSEEYMLCDISGLRILGVDDNATNRKLLEQMLQSWNCHIEVVESAAAALSALHMASAAGNPFQLAIIDMLMPDVDGMTLGRMIKATPNLANTVLIAWSSSGGGEESAESEKVGFVRYLIKPTRQSQLYTAIVKSMALDEKRETPVMATTAAVQTSKYSTRKLRILVAEDNTVNQKVAVALLTKMGHHADVAANGLEAVKSLETIPYDLVFMDVHMPEMDGLEATHQIRDEKSSVRNHNIPVIAMTASAMKGDRELCLAAGMNDYIAKPISPGDVERALQRWSGTSSDEKPVLQTTGIAEENKVFDRAKMLERVGGDEEICTDILKTFLDDIPARIGEMEDAYHHGDTGVLRRAAHTIKGAAGNVSATLLQNAAAQLEAAVIAGEQDSLPLKLDSVKAEFARVKEVMK